MEAVEYISNIPKFAGKTELKNTELLIDELNVKLDDMKIIHVAGTNGKGSVCAYLSNTLVKKGVRTGLFISPHLIKMNERIRINNIPVDDETFNWAFDEVIKASKRMEAKGGKHPAYFEFLFGMAMLIFARENVDIVVLETGLGGRLDSTNIVKHPIMTVITSVSKDHMYILGDTIAEIASEKAGIIKEEVPLVFYGEDRVVYDCMVTTANKQNAPYICIDNSSVTNIQKKGKFIDFSLNNKYYDNVRFSVKSEAFYQVYNSALAATALYGIKDFYNLTVDDIKEGISTAFWEGRMEEVQDNVYVDGAHNEDGIRAFLDTAKAMKDRKQILMFSAVSDKDFDSMIRNICDSKAFDEYVVCAVEYASRAVDAHVFVDTFGKYSDKPVHLFDSVKGALDYSLGIKNEDDRVFIAGSLYLVGEVKELLQ